MSARPRRRKPPSHRPRKIILGVFALAIVFALGAALGAALESGPGPGGLQTQIRTLELVTVTVAEP